jgi:HPt (histidine-containing phosphotransfer) domain-containing protein
MSNPSAPQLSIPLAFAEHLVHRLQEAAKAPGWESLLQEAKSLQKEIDTQFNETPPRH